MSGWLVLLACACSGGVAPEPPTLCSVRVEQGLEVQGRPVLDAEELRAQLTDGRFLIDELFTAVTSGCGAAADAVVTVPELFPARDLRQIVYSLAQQPGSASLELVAQGSGARARFQHLVPYDRLPDALRASTAVVGLLPEGEVVWMDATRVEHAGLDALPAELALVILAADDRTSSGQIVSAARACLERGSPALAYVPEALIAPDPTKLPTSHPPSAHGLEVVLDQAFWPRPP